MRKFGGPGQGGGGDEEGDDGGGDEEGGDIGGGGAEGGLVGHQLLLHSLQEELGVQLQETQGTLLSSQHALQVQLSQRQGV